MTNISHSAQYIEALRGDLQKIQPTSLFATIEATTTRKVERVGCLGGAYDTLTCLTKVLNRRRQKDSKSMLHGLHVRNI